MKVQCHCGAKYAIEVTPEMARDPVRFICPECNADLSGPINELVRKELGLAAAPAAIQAPVPIGIPAPRAESVVSIPPAAPRPSQIESVPGTPAPARLSLSRSASTATHGTAVEQPTQPAATGDEGQPCQKHRGEVIVEHCYVCRKPLCPKCMELFGYVCSPLCKARAESQGIHVPVFAGQRSVRELRESRKTGLIAWAIAVVVIGVIGLWGWYAFYGSRPHSIFSVRFAEMAYAGGSQISTNKQIVFLHGGILARYPLGSKTAVWSNALITTEQLEAQVDRAEKALQDQVADEVKRGVDSEDRIKIPQRYEMEKDIQRGMEASLSLFVQGQNIWVARSGKLTRYDWDTGKATQEIEMPNTFVEPKPDAGELLFTEENAYGQHVITHINLASGETRKEEIGEQVPSAKLAEAAKSTPKGKKGNGGAGLPLQAGGPDANKPLDPGKVAQQAQNLPYARKLTLPAELATSMEQQAALNEMRDDEADPQERAMVAAETEGLYGRSFIQSKYGYVEWSSKLLEAKSVSHSAAKAPPTRSALENNPSVANTAQVANEILNQMQHDRGGDVVTEDVSRYQVTIHRPDAKDVPDWTGEIIGRPTVFEQKTVTVVAGGSSVTVIDKSNKKLWQTDLTHKFGGGSGFESSDSAETTIGEGPCIEHGDALYVFDEATLTAFDLASGNIRWRVPSIGIAGIFFDDQGAMYVNSTTADLDSIKYSRQIDITKKTSVSVLKIDCKSGKVLWNVQPGGFVSHVEGKYVLCFASKQGADLDADALTTLPGMNDSLMDIRRLDAKNGKTVWDYAEQRAPLSVRFHGNIIELVFRKEVEVLKFISF